MRRHLIVRVVAKLFIPLILLFALYVQFHGDYGAGGGFQAGVIFAAGFVLYALVFDLEAAQKVAPARVLRVLMASGLLLYAGVGINSLLLGGRYLDYSVLLEDSVHGQHLGIMLIELGVGVTVASTMINIFYSFLARHR